MHELFRRLVFSILIDNTDPLGKPIVKRLNHEARLDVAMLEPRTRALSTYALQEYFIPEAQFLAFVRWPSCCAPSGSRR